MNEFKGLIIASIDYKEKSKIIYLYTPLGKESVLVKAGKAYKAGNLGNCIKITSSTCSI